MIAVCGSAAHHDVQSAHGSWFLIAVKMRYTNVTSLKVRHQAIDLVYFCCGGLALDFSKQAAGT